LRAASGPGRCRHATGDRSERGLVPVAGRIRPKRPPRLWRGWVPSALTILRAVADVRGLGVASVVAELVRIEADRGSRRFDHSVSATVMGEPVTTGRWATLDAVKVAETFRGPPCPRHTARRARDDGDPPRSVTTPSSSLRPNGQLRPPGPSPPAWWRFSSSPSPCVGHSISEATQELGCVRARGQRGQARHRAVSESQPRAPRDASGILVSSLTLSRIFNCSTRRPMRSRTATSTTLRCASRCRDVSVGHWRVRSRYFPVRLSSATTSRRILPIRQLTTR